MTTVSTDETRQASGPDTTGLRRGIAFAVSLLAVAAIAVLGTLWVTRHNQPETISNAATTAPALPDWGGLWTVDRDPKHPWGIGDPSWTPEAAKQIAALQELDKAGNPRNVYLDCLPEGMPSYIIMTVAALEFLFTPGRVTILGEFDGNRLRRIYTDGRPHPTDPDPTFNGHSIGHWEGDTLVVDTVALFPQNYLPLGQSVALPNNGDMQIAERIHPLGPDKLRFELVITAPHMLTEPWHVTRTFVRQADRKLEITEASCRQGDFVAGLDARGNHIWVPAPHEQGGAPLPFER